MPSKTQTKLKKRMKTTQGLRMGFSKVIESNRTKAVMEIEMENQITQV